MKHQGHYLNYITKDKPKPRRAVFVKNHFVRISYKL